VTEADDRSFAHLSERYQTGAAIMSAVYSPRLVSEDPNEVQRLTVEHLFGEIWQRPGLSTRDRRLLILGVAAAQGNADILDLQLRGGTTNGDLTADDLTEVPIFLLHYVGWPLGTVVQRSAARVAGEASSSA
jgi:4-carboxymuconolactone decarboxylase